MRRRDRYTNLVWIKKMPSDPAQGRVLEPPRLDSTQHELVVFLTGPCGLVLEMEYRDNHFELVCVPNESLEHMGKVRAAASYTGKSLYSLLACAMRDYQVYAASPYGVEWSPRRVIRWVA